MRWLIKKARETRCDNYKKNKFGIVQYSLHWREVFRNSGRLSMEWNDIFSSTFSRALGEACDPPALGFVEPRPLARMNYLEAAEFA